MKRVIADPRLVGRAGRPFNFDEGLKQLDSFFQGKDPVHKGLNRIVKRLERAKIPYVVVGGMAVFLHEYRRATNDVDLLLTPDGLAEFRKRFVPKNYRTVPNRPRRFVDKVNEVGLDILITGDIPGMGTPTPIRFPDPKAVAEIIEKKRVVTLVTLIELKLAAQRASGLRGCDQLDPVQ